MSNKLKRKIYAVRTGHNPGIYDTWEECKAQVSGYPKAEFKSFNSLEDAEIYLIGSDGNPSISYHHLDNIYGDEPVTQPGVAICYTDGSYDDSAKKFSYGLVFFKHNTDVYEEAKAFSNPEFMPSRNVAGEIFGAIRAMELSNLYGIKELHLYYDYSGIAMWATHDWKANTPIARYYQQRIYELSVKGLRVTFHKIKGHSGVKYNERADALAKQALFG